MRRSQAISVLLGCFWMVAMAVQGAESAPSGTAHPRREVAVAEAPSGAVGTAKTSVKSDAGTVSAAGVSAAGSSKPQKAAPEADDGGPQVRLLGVETDVGKRYRWIVPPLPIPPFTGWRKWFREHENSVHCALEWRDDKGQWWNGELRSTHFDVNVAQYRVGWGEFPGTGYDAYGIYIRPGRLEREKDSQGRPLVIVVDEKVDADFRVVEAEIRKYAAKNKRPGDPGTGGKGKENVGLGGPAYKPAQNSNTMVNYVLRKAGVHRAAPDRAVGWNREPDFPYSSDADSPALECRP